MTGSIAVNGVVHSDALRTWLVDNLRQRSFERASIVVMVQGDVVADASVAADGSEPGDRDDALRWLCAVKPVTALVVALLEADGVLSIDQTVGDWLPQFDSPTFRPVTLRRMLQHESILGDVESPAVEHLELGQVLDLAASMPVRSDGSGLWPAYNRILAWNVIAGVVERATGIPIDELCRERVFKPLDMAAWLAIPPDAAPGTVPARVVPPSVRSHGQRIVGDGLVTPSVAARRNPATGGYGSMGSLARMYEAMLQSLTGAGPLPHAVVAGMVERRRGRKTDRGFSRPSDFGMGIQVAMDDHLMARGLSEHSFGHSGAFANERVVTAFADPARDLVVALYLLGVRAPSLRRYRSLIPIVAAL